MLPSTYKDSYRRGGSPGLISTVSGWFRIIFSDKTSRNLFFFLTLNLSFAFVELAYGMWTNSLGLISDSFHMFFDCTALLAGLVAAVIMKWRANERFTFGYEPQVFSLKYRHSYGRAEVLAGFINGLFLLFIAFFIFSEAVERVFEPPHVEHERLLVVSILGFLVNLVGIFAFNHGGANHGHSHGERLGVSLRHHSSPDGGHNHSHNGAAGGASSHGHSHGGQSTLVLEGVFLHILADTLGSVGVIVSSVLIKWFGWMHADPVCSLFIAVLIAVSVMPLLSNSVSILMQRSPRQLDRLLPGCYHRVSQLEGVYSIHEPHFWTLCSDIYVGAVKLEVDKQADADYIVRSAQATFAEAGVRQVYIHLDRTSYTSSASSSYS